MRLATIAGMGEWAPITLSLAAAAALIGIELLVVALGGTTTAAVLAVALGGDGIRRLVLRRSRE